MAYVNQVIGTSTAAMAATEAPYKDAPIIDFINHVQAETVKAALAGTRARGAAGAVAGGVLLADGGDPGRGGDDPGRGGPVRLREHAGGPADDGRAAARTIWSSRRSTSCRRAAGAPVDPAKLTNADNTPDYNYDVVAGWRTRSTSRRRPVRGSRTLTFDGQPVDPDARSSCSR